MDLPPVLPSIQWVGTDHEGSRRLNEDRHQGDRELLVDCWAQCDQPAAWVCSAQAVDQSSGDAQMPRDTIAEV